MHRRKFLATSLAASAATLAPRAGAQSTTQTTTGTGPRQFYQLRRELSTNSTASSELDQIFTNIVAGQIKLAHQQLNQLAKQTSP